MTSENNNFSVCVFLFYEFFSPYFFLKFFEYRFEYFVELIWIHNHIGRTYDGDKPYSDDNRQDIISKMSACYSQCNQNNREFTNLRNRQTSHKSTSRIVSHSSHKRNNNQWITYQDKERKNDYGSYMLHIGDKSHLRSQDDKENHQKEIPQSPHLCSNFKSHWREREGNTCYECAYFHRESEVMKQSGNYDTPCDREEEEKFLRFGDIADKARKNIHTYQDRGGDQNKSFEHRYRECSKNVAISYSKRWYHHQQKRCNNILDNQKSYRYFAIYRSHIALVWDKFHNDNRTTEGDSYGDIECFYIGES